MPALENPRHELFAIARARGALLEDAYEEAGYAARNGHAWRLAEREDVKARIAALRAERTRVEEAFPRTVISILMHLAQVTDALGTPAGAREARASLLQALRLEREVAAARQSDQEMLRKAIGCFDGRFRLERPEAADEQPFDRPPTAIQAPSERPPAALPAPADVVPTAVRAC